MIHTYIRFCAVLLIAYSSFFPLPAEIVLDKEAWRILEQGEIAFSAGEPGEALLLCERARSIHIADFKSYRETLQKALTPSEVRKAGDDINAVYGVLEKRNDSGALAILDAILLNHPVEYFDKSMQGLLDWLKAKLVYPESDFLSGKIYEAEGEYSLALEYYEKAWKNKIFLDIPDERFTLAYKMADLAFDMGNYGKREEYLLLVISEDPVFGTPDLASPTLKAMIKTLESEKTTEKFFNLYRHSNYPSQKAYQDLASHYFYHSGKRLDRAMPVAVLSACIAFTLLCEALTQADFEFVYHDFGDVVIRAGKNVTLAQWARETHIWDSFVLLSSILIERGYSAQARSLLTVLSRDCPEKPVALQAGNLLLTLKE